MTNSFVIRANGNPQKFTDVTFKGAAVTYSFDFAPWAEDNSTVTSVSWSVESGDASISGATLTGTMASALVTTPEAGRSVIKITATTGTEKYVAYLDVLAKDLQCPVSDYGFYYG